MTINRWIQRRDELGNILPFKHTGNNRATREIRHHELVELALYKKVFPKSYTYEVAAHLHNRNPAVRPRSNSQICRAQQRLRLSRKRASTTAYKAYIPRNLTLRRMYFNETYPLGMVGTLRENIIDIDEMGLQLENCNRKHGNSLVGDRCDDKGHFINGLPKQNTLAAISGDNNDPMRWLETWTGEGTTLHRFLMFVHRVCEDLSVRHPGRTFCFTMDNLNVHKNVLVIQEIMNHGYRVVFRAPYWSCDGAIEYVFCTIHSYLLKHHGDVANLDALY